MFFHRAILYIIFIFILANSAQAQTTLTDFERGTTAVYLHGKYIGYLDFCSPKNNKQVYLEHQIVALMGLDASQTVICDNKIFAKIERAVLVVSFPVGQRIEIKDISIKPAYQIKHITKADPVIEYAPYEIAHPIKLDYVAGLNYLGPKNEQAWLGAELMHFRAGGLFQLSLNTQANRQEGLTGRISRGLYQRQFNNSLDLSVGLNSGGIGVSNQKREWGLSLRKTSKPIAVANTDRLFSTYVIEPGTLKVYARGLLINEIAVDTGFYETTVAALVSGSGTSANTVQIEHVNSSGLVTYQWELQVSPSTLLLPQGESDYKVYLGQVELSDTGNGRAQYRPAFALTYKHGLHEDWTAGIDFIHAGVYRKYSFNSVLQLHSNLYLSGGHEILHNGTSSQTGSFLHVSQEFHNANLSYSLNRNSCAYQPKRGCLSHRLAYQLNGGRELGTLSFGLQALDFSPQRELQTTLNWSKNIGHSLAASVGLVLQNRPYRQLKHINFTLSWRPGAGHNLTTYWQRSARQKAVASTVWTRQRPEQRVETLNLSGVVGQPGSESLDYNTEWRMRAGSRLSAAASIKREGAPTARVSTAGSLVYFDGHWMPSQAGGEGLILIRSPQTPNVDLSMGLAGSDLIRLNEHGTAAIVVNTENNYTFDISPYEDAVQNFSVTPLRLKMPRKHTAIVSGFKLNTVQRGWLRLVNGKGQPLPYGVFVKMDGHSEVSPVLDDGLAFLDLTSMEQPERVGLTVINTKANKACRAAFAPAQIYGVGQNQAASVVCE